eukprot:g23595.t1
MTEYHVYGAVEAAAGVFRLGLERYGDREPSLLAAYVNFLIGCNDLRSARAELTQGVLDKLQQAVRDKLANREESRAMRESLAFLWQKWARNIETSNETLRLMKRIFCKHQSLLACQRAFRRSKRASDSYIWCQGLAQSLQ